MNANDNRPWSRASNRPCPICRKPAQPAFKPFCSKRCSDVDLNRWLVGSYAIPSSEVPDADGDEPRPIKPEDDV